MNKKQKKVLGRIIATVAMLVIIIICEHIWEINRYIFDCIKNGERELTEENIEMHFTNMYRIASEYPYEEIWAE